MIHVPQEASAFPQAAASFCVLVCATAAPLFAQADGACYLGAFDGDPLGPARPLAADGDRALLQLRPEEVTFLERSGPTWIEVAALPAPDFALYGAQHGDLAAVGQQFGLDLNVYERVGGMWRLQEALTLPNYMGFGSFRSVEMSSDLILVRLLAGFGAMGDVIALLERAPAGWELRGTYPTGQHIGMDVEGRVVAYGQSTSLATYVELVEVLPGGAPRRLQRISPPAVLGPLAGLGFARELDLDGDRLAVTSRVDANGDGVPGAVLIYERDASGAFVFSAAIDNPAALGPHAGAVSFATSVQLAGGRLAVGLTFSEPLITPRGVAVYDLGSTGWVETALIMPSAAPETRFGADFVLANGEVLAAAGQVVPGQNAGLDVLRWSIGVPTGAEVCAGSASSGAVPEIALAECANLSGGELVFSAQGFTSGTLHGGLARGAYPVTPGGPQLCIRPFGLLGAWTPTGQNSGQFVVPAAVVQTLPVLAGEALLVQAWSAAPVGSTRISNALAVVLGP
ncbi:MAG: hypothetical protein R3F49_17085 [Planctomycetota bacterium]